jgi:hypothetical protein
LPKVPVTPDKGDEALYYWMQLLKANSKDDLQVIDTKDPALGKAVDMIIELNGEEAVREAAWRAQNARWKAAGERKAAIDIAVDTAVKKEREKSEKEIEKERKKAESDRDNSIRFLKSKGVDIKIISDGYGLTPAEIMDL